MAKYQPTPDELASFSEGMYLMYDFIRDIDPSLTVFPLRGAYPFRVAYQKIADLSQEKESDILMLPLGTFNDLEQGRQRGLKKPEKKDLIELELLDYLSKHPKAKNILLIDEVMHGGTILTCHSYMNFFLRNFFPEIELSVCAVEHGLREQKGRYVNKAKRHGFKRIKVDSLFVMDRPQYLPRVIKNGTFSVNTEDTDLDDILEQLEKDF